jgi:hypothetical protein
MRQRSSVLAVAVFALSSLAPIATAGAQIMSYKNTNYGLLAGEAQYLLVSNPVPTLSYSFQYIINSPFDLLTPSLKANFAYDVQISGRIGLGPLDRGTAMMDAAYYPAFHDIDAGILYPIYKASDPSVTFWTEWDGVMDRRPSVDGYQPTHVYDYFIQGRGAGLAFSFRECCYGDNVGSFDVKIFELGELVSPTITPEPSTYALMAAGLLGLGLATRRRRKSSNV